MLVGENVVKILQNRLFCIGLQYHPLPEPELLMGDIGTWDLSLHRIPPPKLELPMEGTGVWRLPPCPRGFRFVDAYKC